MSAADVLETIGVRVVRADVTPPTGSVSTASVLAEMDGVYVMLRAFLRENDRPVDGSTIAAARAILSALGGTDRVGLWVTGMHLATDDRPNGDSEMLERALDLRLDAVLLELASRAATDAGCADVLLPLQLTVDGQPFQMVASVGHDGGAGEWAAEMLFGGNEVLAWGSGLLATRDVVAGLEQALEVAELSVGDSDVCAHPDHRERILESWPRATAAERVVMAARGVCLDCAMAIRADPVPPMPIPPMRWSQT